MKPLLAALTACAALGMSAAPVVAAEVAYKLDEAHTETMFVIDRFGFNSVIGLFAKTEGMVWLDEAAPEKSRVEATVHIDSLLSAHPGRDEHLKAARWLNAPGFPTATFKSTKVELTSPTTAKVTGDLTLLGVAQPTVLQVKMNKIGSPPNNPKRHAGFTITGEISRKAFGSVTGAGAIGDSVAIRIEALAIVQ